MPSPPVPLAAVALPALKPNQPTHSIAGAGDAHSHVVRRHISVPYPFRLPRTSAHIRAAIPALRCTTVPPAKSRAPK